MVVATRLKWQVLSGVMRTIGCTSRGIALGYEQGFDSGVMLDYVYENRARGRLGIGPVIDWVYLHAIGWRAIRARRVLLTAVLREAVTVAVAGRKPVAVLDVAGGPGRYLQDLCRAWLAEEQPVTVICRDLDARGLALGREQAAAAGLPNIRYEQGDAFDPRSLATVRPAPGIVVVSGLYELFVDSAPIRRSLQAIYDLLPPGGRLIFTTQVRHPQLDFIANVLVNRDGQPWVMVCRPLAEVEGWARAAGFDTVQSQLEPVGLFGVTICYKS